MERPRFTVLKKSLDQGSSSKSGEASSDLRMQPQGESIMVPGDYLIVGDFFTEEMSLRILVEF